MNLNEIREQSKLYEKIKDDQAPDGEYFFAFSNEQFNEGEKRIKESSQEQILGAGIRGCSERAKALMNFMRTTKI